MRRGLDDTPALIGECPGGGVVEPVGSQVASDRVASLECAEPLPRDATDNRVLSPTPSTNDSGPAASLNRAGAADPQKGA
jgi:hypothetical protein